MSARWDRAAAAVGGGARAAARRRRLGQRRPLNGGAAAPSLPTWPAALRRRLWGSWSPPRWQSRCSVPSCSRCVPGNRARGRTARPTADAVALRSSSRAAIIAALHDPRSRGRAQGHRPTAALPAQQARGQAGRGARADALDAGRRPHRGDRRWASWASLPSRSCERTAAGRRSVEPRGDRRRGRARRGGGGRHPPPTRAPPSWPPTARMETALASVGLARRPSDGAARVPGAARGGARRRARPATRRGLTELFERARFSPHPVGEDLREQAIGAPGGAPHAARGAGVNAALPAVASRSSSPWAPCGHCIRALPPLRRAAAGPDPPSARASGGPRATWTA